MIFTLKFVQGNRNGSQVLKGFRLFKYLLPAILAACSSAGIFVKRSFAAAQILDFYPGEQRDKVALIASKHFKFNVWRWIFAGKGDDKQLTRVLRNVWDSIVAQAGKEGAQEIEKLGQDIAGSFCALVRFELGTKEMLVSRGLHVIPEANFYVIKELYRLPAPVVCQILKDKRGYRLRTDRRVVFGTHVENSVKALLGRQIGDLCLNSVSSSTEEEELRALINTKVEVL